MIYKAIKEIGDYKVGDEVPADKAQVWLKMYKTPQVELVDGKSAIEEPEVVDKESNSILEDYLARNKGVVVKNIKEDDLTKEQLEKLLLLEKYGKNRKDVVKTVEKRLD